MRVVAVLGYSVRRRNGLDAVCLARLRHAEALAADVVVLSGWARRRANGAEAELMRDAWQGPTVPLICDTTARNTAQNAAAIAAIARDLKADEVVVVTSRWHAPRTWLLVRAALAGSGVHVRISSPRGPLRPRLLAREVGCMAMVPYHLLRSRAGRS
jgi:thiazole synthase ThiGH ThiG subunit